MYKFDQKRERRREWEQLALENEKMRDLNAYAFDIRAYRQFTIFAIDKKKRVWSNDVVKAFC